MRALVPLLILVLSSTVVQATDRSTQLDDIREATYRYQFTNPDVRSEIKVYFLGLKNGEKDDRFHDPSENFMKRFVGEKPRVAMASAAHLEMDDVHDLKTREKGTLLFITGTRWISDNKVEVTGGYTGFGFAGYTYELRKRKGGWAVVKCSQTSMS